MNTSHCTLHSMITVQRSYIEVQIRTKQMDDIAEIGPANHLGYEKKQEKSAPEEMRFQEVSAFILMRRMSAE